MWPQWQGAGTSSIRDLAPEFPFEEARRGYAVGSAVLAAVLPAPDGPTAAAPVAMDDTGLELRDGIEAKDVILAQLAQAFEVIREHDPARIATLGGECAVSVAPFAHLSRRYSDDLAIVWIDSHPDIGTPASEYPGFHAMAVAAITGHGDPESCDCCRRRCPATASRWPDCTRMDRGRHRQCRRMGYPLVQPGRAADNHPAAAGLAGRHGLLPGGHPLRRGHRRQQ
jgi:hypothetical protein